MAKLIAMKNRATAAINGEVSSDGLSAMLGDEGDLQSMLIESVKKGGEILKGSAEDWINQTSDRARELLANIGKKKKKTSILEQFVIWVEQEIKGETTKAAILRDKEKLVSNIETGLVPGFEVNGEALQIDLIEAFGFDRAFVSDGAILYHLSKPQLVNTSSTPVPVTKIDTSSVVDVKIIELQTVKDTNRKKNKKTSTSEGQLVFDLFA